MNPASPGGSLLGMYHQSALWFLTAALFILVVMMPARILQKRHGYPVWVLAFGLVPYVGLVFMIWALALSAPRDKKEAA